jgi:PhnB protein
VTATFALHVLVPDADTTVAKAAAVGAVVQRPVDEQLAGYRMGTVMDPFGIRWMIANASRLRERSGTGGPAEEFSRSGATTGPLG